MKSTVLRAQAEGAGLAPRPAAPLPVPGSMGTWWSALASSFGGSPRPDPTGGDDAQYCWLLPGDMAHAAAPPRAHAEA